MTYTIEIIKKEVGAAEAAGAYGDVTGNAANMFRAIKFLLARVEELKVENKRLKTTLKGTQTVLAGAVMAFADKQPE